MCIILQLISLGESTVNGAIAVQISCKNFALRDLGCGLHSGLRRLALAAQVHRSWSTKEAANRRNAVHSLPWFSTNSRLPVLLPERHLASPTLTFPPNPCLFEMVAPEMGPLFWHAPARRRLDVCPLARARFGSGRDDLADAAERKNWCSAHSPKLVKVQSSRPETVTKDVFSIHM